MHRYHGLHALATLFLLLAPPHPAIAQNQTYADWLAADRAAQGEYNETVTRQYQEFVEQE